MLHSHAAPADSRVKRRGGGGGGGGFGGGWGAVEKSEAVSVSSRWQGRPSQRRGERARLTEPIPTCTSTPCITERPPRPAAFL